MMLKTQFSSKVDLTRFGNELFNCHLIYNMKSEICVYYILEFIALFTKLVSNIMYSSDFIFYFLYLPYHGEEKFVFLSP